jgi:hypothetical protein
MELSGLSRFRSGLEVAPVQGSSAHSVKTRWRFSVSSRDSSMPVTSVWPIVPVSKRKVKRLWFVQ